MQCSLKPLQNVNLSALSTSHLSAIIFLTMLKRYVFLSTSINKNGNKYNDLLNLSLYCYKYNN